MSGFLREQSHLFILSFRVSAPYFVIVSYNILGSARVPSFFDFSAPLTALGLRDIAGDRDNFVGMSLKISICVSKSKLLLDFETRNRA